MLFLLSSCKQNNSSLSLLVSTAVVGKEISYIHAIQTIKPTLILIIS